MVNSPTNSPISPRHNPEDKDTPKEDNISALPSEVIQLIFSYISPTQDISSVSKLFSENRLIQLNSEFRVKALEAVDGATKSIEALPPSATTKKAIDKLNALKDRIQALDHLSVVALFKDKNKIALDILDAIGGLSSDEIHKLDYALFENFVGTIRIQALLKFSGMNNVQTAPNPETLHQEVKNLLNTQSETFLLNSCLLHLKNLLERFSNEREKMYAFETVLIPLLSYGGPDEYEHAYQLRGEIKDPYISTCYDAALLNTITRKLHNDSQNIFKTPPLPLQYDKAVWFPRILELTEKLKGSISDPLLTDYLCFLPANLTSEEAFKILAIIDNSHIRGNLALHFAHIGNFDTAIGIFKTLPHDDYLHHELLQYAGRANNAKAYEALEGDHFVEKNIKYFITEWNTSAIIGLCTLYNKNDRAKTGEQLRLLLDEQLNSPSRHGNVFSFAESKLFSRLITDYGDTLPEGWADQHASKFINLFRRIADYAMDRDFTETADLVFSLPDKTLKEKIVNATAAALRQDDHDQYALQLENRTL